MTTSPTWRCTRTSNDTLPSKLSKWADSESTTSSKLRMSAQSMFLITTNTESLRRNATEFCSKRHSTIRRKRMTRVRLAFLTVSYQRQRLIRTIWTARSPVLRDSWLRSKKTSLISTKIARKRSKKLNSRSVGISSKGQVQSLLTRRLPQRQDPSKSLQTDTEESQEDPQLLKRSQRRKVQARAPKVRLIGWGSALARLWEQPSQVLRELLTMEVLLLMKALQRWMPAPEVALVQFQAWLTPWTVELRQFNHMELSPCRVHKLKLLRSLQFLMRYLGLQSNNQTLSWFMPSQRQVSQWALKSRSKRLRTTAIRFHGAK